ncbi:hypothetical protein FHL15_009930 [Xylaria flabelliformis]|uniref:TauD/TfdA-like domain-containing protein n=1 Tax=Xylaria flabelliformis TaxID=2512241 RepID=A0A553HMP4_9PEZI|nr:hypothetical protein FHL15_009930 [Xylaria flabelliformis]
MPHAIDQYWVPQQKEYQKELQITRGASEPVIRFPLVVQPHEPAKSKADVLKEIGRIAAQPSDKDEQSQLRKLLDANGGVVHFKGLPLKTPEDFSDFLVALAGQGQHAWIPHTDIGMEVLRRPRAKHVLTTNEGPPSHFIGWHNEYAVSPVHPGYLILFCEVPPEKGGHTSVVSSLALFDRLKGEVPGFVEGCASKGLVYQIPHTATQVGGIVGGNGLYKASAFGPTDGSAPPDTEEEKRKGVERRIIELAERGGWHADIDKKDTTIPVWQRRGFDWTWQENGDLEVVHRVPGVRMHPTQKKPSIFNAMSTRYTNAKVNNTWEPPFTFKKEDGTEGIAIPPHFSGMDKDEVIPKEWLDRMDFHQHDLTSDIEWNVGDVLVIDNYAAQHARWAWEGERKILASFWDQPGMAGQPMATA